MAACSTPGNHRLPKQKSDSFQTTGYGCTTRTGNAGPFVGATEDSKLAAVNLLSDNRNFEVRVHPKVRKLPGQPPSVVASPLLGYIREDITTQPLGTGTNGLDREMACSPHRPAWRPNLAVVSSTNGKAATPLIVWTCARCRSRSDRLNSNSLLS